MNDTYYLFHDLCSGEDFCVRALDYAAARSVADDNFTCAQFVAEGDEDLALGFDVYE